MAIAATVGMLATGCSSERLRSAVDNPASVTTTADPTTLPPATTTATTTPATTSTTTTSTTSTLPPTTTSTTIPLVTDGAVVLVANASGVNGAAAKLAADLEARGYRTNGAVNAAGIEDDLDVSKIYFLPAGEAAARSLADVMGGLVVAPMPTPAWIEGATAALGDTTVLVMLGHDLAGATIPGISAD
jgi:hypothetical protein